MSSYGPAAITAVFHSHQVIDCKEGKQNTVSLGTLGFSAQFPLQPGLVWVLLVPDQGISNLTLLPLPLTKSPGKVNVPWVSSVKITV